MNTTPPRQPTDTHVGIGEPRLKATVSQATCLQLYFQRLKSLVDLPEGCLKGRHFCGQVDKLHENNERNRCNHHQGTDARFLTDTLDDRVFPVVDWGEGSEADNLVCAKQRLQTTDAL